MQHCPFSKSIDNLSIDPVAATSSGGLTTTAARTPADARNYNNERARSDFDQAHVLNWSGIFELPFGKGKKLMGSPNPRDASVGSPAVNSTVFGQACCVTLSTASSATTNQNGESWRVIQLALKLSF